jgi:glutamine cyclotransferase
LFALTGCGESSRPALSATSPASTAPDGISHGGTNAACPTYTYDVVNVWPHDPNAFTQGLLYLDGALLESTGLNGESTLRRVELKTGQVLQQVDVPAEYFAEGLAVLNGKAFQLTWQNHKGFVYDVQNFQLEKEFELEGEGWGLTTDGRSLVSSDGTDHIRFLNPTTFAVERVIQVRYQGRPLANLNELEFVKGEIFANIWGSDWMARIDPSSGQVIGLIDFRGLWPASERRDQGNVLNGIAYDAAADRILVTGKRWPKLFEVRLKPKKGS